MVRRVGADVIDHRRHPLQLGVVRAFDKLFERGKHPIEIAHNPAPVPRIEAIECFVVGSRPGGLFSPQLRQSIFIPKEDVAGNRTHGMIGVWIFLSIGIRRHPRSLLPE
jgi:hypothetical protein